MTNGPTHSGSAPETPGDEGPLTRTFLVEHYWPGMTASAFGVVARKVRAGAERVAREGADVRFLHSTFVPDDETAFCVLVAESESAVEEAYRRAGIEFERAVEALELEGSRAAAAEQRRQ